MNVTLLPALAFLSSDDITEAELLAWLQPLGVERGTQDQLTPHSIQRGEGKLWFSAPEAVAAATPDGIGEVEATRYAMALGAPARVRIEAFYGRNDGSRRLAVEFTLRLGERWAGIVESEHGELLAIADLRARYARDPAHTDLSDFHTGATPDSAG